MGTSLEPLLSSSTMRHQLPPTTAKTTADILPKIDFGFDDLRDRMAKFTLRFDQFIDEGRKRVLEERNQFRSRVAELQGKNHPSSYSFLANKPQRIRK
jgi:kinetochore protein Spc25